MRIIISPAKKMHVDTDSLAPEGLPQFLPEARRLLSALRAMPGPALQALWNLSLIHLWSRRLKDSPSAGSADNPWAAKPSRFSHKAPAHVFSSTAGMQSEIRRRSEMCIRASIKLFFGVPFEISIFGDGQIWRIEEYKITRPCIVLQHRQIIAAYDFGSFQGFSCGIQAFPVTNFRVFVFPIRHVELSLSLIHI